MSENPFAKYGMPQRNDSSNPFAKYGSPDQEREKIIDAYAKDIERRQQIYGGLPAEKLKDPATLYALAEREAEREGWKMPETQKQDRVSSFVLGYGQGGTFGFADELSGAVDFVGGAGAGLLRGEGLGAIESGKQAYSNRVEADRRLMRQARVDNPVTTIAGELTGGIVTTAPAPVGLVGGGARTTGQVALQTADKAAKLQQAAQAATGARQARLAAKSAALSAKAAKLSLPAQTLGQAASRFGGRLAESTGKGLGYGAAYGGIYGAGTAEGNIGERLDEAAFGAAIGGVAGGALTPAIQFIAAPIVSRIGYGILTSADNKALDIVLRRAERSGTSLQKVQSDFDAWAKTGEVPETLAELMGPNERSLLSALITVNRETREQATDVFVGRGRGEVNRLEDAFTKSFGASRKDYQATKAAAAQARAKEAEPFYEGAYIDATTGQRKFLGQPETDQLAYEIGGSRVAQSTLSTASDYADALGKRAIRDEIDDFAKAMKDGRPVRPLSVEAADYIERGINRRYGAATKGEAQDIPAGLRGLRDRVRTIIDPSGLGDARATAAEAIRRGELLEEGLDIMLPTVDVDDVTRVMGGIPDLGIPPASAEGRKAYGVGASRAIGLKLRETPDMRGFADATQKVARSPSLRDKLDAARPKDLVTDPAILNIQKKLDAGKKLTAKQQLRLDQFGKQFAEKQGSAQTRANAELDQAIERAAERAQFGVDMVGNSRTAFRQGDVEDALLDDAVATQVGQGLSDLIIGGPGMAGASLFNQFGRNAGRFLSQPSIYRPNINRAAANVLLATGEEIPKQIARLAARAANRNVTRITMRGMPPPAGGGTAASGFAPALRTDLGNAAGGALGGGIMPIPSTGDPQEDMRNRMGAVLGGAALGFGARRFVGRGASARGQGMGNFGGGTPPAPGAPPRPPLSGPPAEEGTAAAGFGFNPFRKKPLPERVFPPYEEMVASQGAKTAYQRTPEHKRIEGEINKAFTDISNAEDTIAKELRGMGYNWEGEDDAFMGVIDSLRREGRLGNFLTSQVEDLQNASRRLFDAQDELKAYMQGVSGTRASGIGGALRTDLGNAAGGALGGGIMPLPSTGDPEQDMRNRLGMIGGGAALGFGARRFAGRGASARGQGMIAPKTPQQAMRAELPGSPEYEAAVAKGLDMSTPARMARAKDMGFDTETVLYHGTPDRRPIDAEGFKTSAERNQQFLMPEARTGEKGPYWFTESQRKARSYADDSRAFDSRNAEPAVLQVFLRKPSNPLIIDAGGTVFSDIPRDRVLAALSPEALAKIPQNWRRPGGDSFRSDDIVKIARDAGFDGIQIRNVIDDYSGQGRPGNTYATFDPSNIRSVNAAFDPDKAASPILTAGLGGGGKRPRKDSPEAILAGVQKITAQLKAKGTQAATPQQPEMRIGRGLAKAAGITDNRELGAKAARDMLAAGRSPAEIFTATNHVPMTVDGNTIMVRAAGKSPDEVTAAFWQEMAKPVSRRAEWIREQTRSIKPIGPDAIARQPLETRAQVATSMIQQKGDKLNPQALWEETDMIVIMRAPDGQPVLNKVSVPTGAEPVSLMDGANFKSWDDAIEYLRTVAKLPRAEQPAWYRENFSDPLTLNRPASTLQRAGDFAQRNQNTVGATLVGGAALGGTAGVLTAKDTPASIRIKLEEPPQRQNRR